MAMRNESGAGREKSLLGRFEDLLGWVDTDLLLPTKAKEHDGLFGGFHVSPEDGVVTLPDGQLRSIIEVDPIDLGTLTPLSKNLVANRLGALAGSLAAGQTVQILVESRPLSVKEVLPDILRHMRADTRQEQRFVASYGAWLRNTIQRLHLPDLRFYLVVAPIPPSYVIGQRAEKLTRERLQESLLQARNNVIGHLKAMGVTYRVLRHEAVLAVLWNGTHHSTRDRCPSMGYFVPGRESLRDKSKDEVAQVSAYWLQQCLFDLEVEETVDCVRIDNRRGHTQYAYSTYLIAPPEITSCGYLEPILTMEIPFRLSIFVRGLSKKMERFRLNTQRRALGMIVRDAEVRGRVASMETELAALEATRLAQETLRPMVAVTRMSVYMTVFGSSREEAARLGLRVRNAFQNQLGAEVAFARGEQLPFWRSTLPLGVDVARDWYRTVSQTVGDGIPFLCHNPGTPGGMFLGLTPIGMEIVRFDPADPSLPTSLMSVMGRSGSGKTFLACKFVLYTLLTGGRVTVVDRAGHYETVKSVFGGVSVRMADRQSPAINPWDLPDMRNMNRHERDAAMAQKIAFVVGLHDVLLADNKEMRLSRFERGLIERGVKAVYERCQEARVVPRERYLFQWMEEQLQDPAMEAEERRVLNGLKVSLGAYVFQGSAAWLVDRETTVDMDTRMLIFDTRDVDDSMIPLCMFMISEAVSRRAGAQKALDEDRTVVRDLLVIDEGWFLIKYGQAARWLDDLARRGRHLGLFLLFITQQISDFSSNETAAALFNAAAVHFVFRQNDGGSGSVGKDEAERIASALRLTAPEGHRIMQLTTKAGESAQVYLVRESKLQGALIRGEVMVIPQPHEYWFFSSDPIRDVPERNRMIEACGGDVMRAVCRLANRRGLPKSGEMDDDMDDLQAMISLDAVADAV